MINKNNSWLIFKNVIKTSKANSLSYLNLHSGPQSKDKLLKISKKHCYKKKLNIETLYKHKS